MRKLTILIFILFTFFSHSQVESDKKLDSLMHKFSIQKGIEKAATAKKIGSYYKNNSQYYKAIEYQQIARDLYENATNLSSEEKAKNKALCDINIGAEYFFIGDHKKAMDYYIKAYKVVPENIDLLLNMEGVFSSQDNLEKAFYYAELAEKIAKKTNNLSELDRIWSLKVTFILARKIL